MSLTTIEPNKQLYTLLYQYADDAKIAYKPEHVFYMGSIILTTDHAAIVEHTTMLANTFPHVIYSISTVTQVTPTIQ